VCLGITACSFTYPLDVVRSRLAFQVADEKIYCGVCHVIRQIVSTEGGFTALYRGYGATALAMIPAVGECCNFNSPVIGSFSFLYKANKLHKLRTPPSHYVTITPLVALYFNSYSCTYAPLLVIYSTNCISNVGKCWNHCFFHILVRKHIVLYFFHNYFQIANDSS